ncbi:MAG: hypothetical protein V1909_02025, partial [Candidatus Micrarchaeota archaeon]
MKFIKEIYGLTTSVICVSEYRLNQMTYDDINETATHEVAHLIDATHNPSFRQAHVQVKTAAWRPQNGFLSGGSDRTPVSNKPAKPIKPHKRYCNYHLCRKKRKLEECPNCNGYYCSEHIRPKRPSMMNFESTAAEDIANRLDTSGHPCPQYAEILIKEKRLQTERYEKALDALKENPVYESQTTGNVHIPGNVREEVPETPEQIIEKIKGPKE